MSVEIEFAPNIKQRVANQLDRERKMRRRGESRPFSVGSYTKPEDDIVEGFHPKLEFYRSNGLTTLEGFEVFLYETAQDLLAIKSESPVIMLDVGGGAAASWSKVAKVMEDEVAASRIAFVSSNLTASPDEQIGIHRIKAAQFNYGVSFDVNSIRNDVESGKGLVHHINSRFGALGRQTIALPNGTVVPLKGSTDFVNEKYSVTTHSLVPELDVVRVAGLLSPHGVYAVNRLSFLDPNTTDVFVPQRRKGSEYAHKAIQNSLGFREVPAVEVGKFGGVPFGNHKIFKGPLAPILRIR